MTVTEVYTEITEHYMGSCNSLAYEDSEWLEGNDLLDTLCETCGWWCEISDCCEYGEDEEDVEDEEE